MGNSFSPRNTDLVGKHSFIKWFYFINTSPCHTQILSYDRPLFLPGHGRLRCYTHNKDYFKILLMLLQKVEWSQFASPQEAPLAVTRAINRTQPAPGDSFGTMKSPPPLQIPHRAESGAQERAHNISHPEETRMAGGSPGLHPPDSPFF